MTSFVVALSNKLINSSNLFLNFKKCYCCVSVHEACVEKGGSIHASICIWRSEDSSVELVLSFHVYVCSVAGIQVTTHSA